MYICFFVNTFVAFIPNEKHIMVIRIEIRCIIVLMFNFVAALYVIGYDFSISKTKVRSDWFETYF